MKGIEGLAQALVAEGVDTVFTLIGGGVDELARLLKDEHRIRVVEVRHEEVAVGMADGYARATGKIGVAIVCMGPGLANACAPMIALKMAKSPVLVIVGDTTPEDRHGPMTIAQTPLLEATVGHVVEALTVGKLSENVALALRHIRLGRGPAALHLGPGMRQSIPEGWRYDGQVLSSVDRATVVPSPKDVQAVAALLRESKRPLILAGRGAYRAGARESLVELARRSGALLATSLLARDWFAGDPYSLGLSGGFAMNQAVPIFKQADLLVVFGASLNSYTFGHGMLYPQARIVHVDIDPGAIDDWTPAHKGVVADARAMAQALLLELAPQQRPGWRDEAMARRIREIDRFAGRDMVERPGGANPRRVVEALDRLLPRERILLTDIGYFMGIPAAYMTVKSPGDIVLPWHLGRVGCGLPVALGAAAGRPGVPVAAFVGDGGFMAALNALDTVSTLGLPVIIVVMDNQGFEAERRLFEMRGVSTDVGSYRTPDLAALGRTLGLQAARITNAASIESALRGFDPTRPVLLHVVLDRESPPDEMDIAQRRQEI